MAKELFHACDLPEGLISSPLKFQTPLFGDMTPEFNEFVAPALITLLMFAMPLTYGAAVVLQDKHSGAISRSIVAGTSLLEILGAHAIVQIGVQLLQTITAIALMYWILQFPFENPYLSALLLILQGFSGISFAFTLASACSSLNTVACVGTACVLGCTFIGGMMWPIEGMHPSLKPLCWLSPITFTIKSLRSLTIRGWGLAQQEVYLGFVSSIFWIFAFTLITCIYLKRTNAGSFLANNI